MGQSTERESRLVVARGGGREEWAMALWVQVSFGGDENVGD